MTTGCNESDWKLFSKRLPGWRKAFLEKAFREYGQLLSGPGDAEERFDALQERIREDRARLRMGGLRVSRSYLEQNMQSLFIQGVITAADLEGFSSEMRQKVLGMGETTF